MADLIERARFYNPVPKEQLSRSGDKREEARAKKAIARFVTDPEGSTYVITENVPALFVALAMVRYSRTPLSGRQLLWQEFVTLKVGANWRRVDAGFNQLARIFNYARAEELAERVISGFGDESAQEGLGKHAFWDRKSQIAAKVIEDTRIGISPIEKSTRYVVFDQKGPDGDYLYYKDPKIMDSRFKDQYLASIRGSFDFYAESVQGLQPFLRGQVPIELQSFPDLSKEGSPSVPFAELSDSRSLRAARSAYNQSIRAKACDIARVLLPAATLTNIGEFGNARAYAYMLLKMRVHPLAEMQVIAEEGVREFKKVAPKFFDVVDDKRGLSYQRYIRQSEDALERRAKDVLGHEVPERVDRVELLQLDTEDRFTNIAAALLYPYSNLPLRQIIGILKQSDPQLVGDIIYEDNLKFRTDRRHKPLRAFEIDGYPLIFDIMGNFGIYRDLQRQRMLTQQHQRYTTEHGYDMPLEFAEAGLEEGFREVMDRVKDTHQDIGKEFPLESQYVTGLANYMRWYMGMNLREGFWVSELRSTPQGHFSYRTIAQDMFLQAKQVYPGLQNLVFSDGQFVDMTDRSRNLERLSAMQRIEIKTKEADERYGRDDS